MNFYLKRDSSESLNYKFDDKTGSTASINVAEIETEFTVYDNVLGNAENWAALQTESFLQSLSKNVRNKQENIFEFLKTEISFVKMLNITQKVKL